MFALYAMSHSEHVSDSSGTDTGDDRWLEHLTGAYSQKPRYFGRWRRTNADLERTLRTLQEVAAAFSATTEGTEVMARSIATAASRHFTDAWSVMTVEGRILARAGVASSTAATLAEQYTRDPVIESECSASSGANEVPVASLGDVALDEVARHLDAVVAVTGVRHALVVRGTERALIVDPLGDCKPGGVLEDVLALGAPIVINEKVVGSLVLTFWPIGVVDESDLMILSILASQGAVAYEAARRFEERVFLHQQAHDAWQEAARMAEKLEARTKELEKAHVALDMAARQSLLALERQRIAEELHDGVVQHLVGIGMFLESSRRASSEPQIVERLASAQELTRVTLGRLRRAIFELASVSDGKVELISTLRGLVQELQMRADIRLDVRGNTTDLSVPMIHGLFHIIQEATFNAINHGCAKRVWIELVVGERIVSLNVADDGGGDPNVVAAILVQCDDGTDLTPYHRGFPGMRRRANELGGTLLVRGRRGGGIRVNLRAPVRRIGTHEVDI